MMNRSPMRSIAACIATLLLNPATAHPARPMITDDARTVDSYACQVESWVRTNRGSSEYWALKNQTSIDGLPTHILDRKR